MGLKDMSVKKGLESLVKRYLPLAGLAIFEVPIHETLHAGFAKVLPHVGCDGVVLSNNSIAGHVLKYASLGFYTTEELPPGLGGYARIATDPDFLGYFSSAVTAAGPEVATMTLGFYLIKKAVNNINDAGKRLYSIACAYAGMAFASSTFHYLKTASLSPGENSDHLLFTKNVIQMLHLPGFIAPLFTVAGAAAMVAGSLYLANKIPVKDDQLD